MRHLRATAVVLTVLTLAGCTGRAEVDVTVRSAQSADVTIAVELTGDAAAVTHADPALLDEVVATVESRTGAAAQVDSSEDRVRVWAKTQYAALTESADITGVAGVVLSPAGDDGTVRARVSLTAAPLLLEAIANATADQPDAEALAQTMVRSTLLVVTVRFPGGVDTWQASGSGQDAAVASKDTVTVTRELADAGPGLIDVTGNPAQPVSAALVAVGAFLIVVAGLAAWARRRDRTAPVG